MPLSTSSAASARLGAAPLEARRVQSRLSGTSRAARFYDTAPSWHLRAAAAAQGARTPRASQAPSRRSVRASALRNFDWPQALLFDCDGVRALPSASWQRRWRAPAACLAAAPGPRERTPGPLCRPQVLVDTEAEGHRAAFNEAFKRRGASLPPPPPPCLSLARAAANVFPPAPPSPMIRNCSA
jgi:hypothetical protein